LIGFWFFMFIISLLIPFIMVGLGNYFYKNPPKKNNLLFGYRTARSIQSPETWAFAHHYCGKLWVRTGRIMLIISPVAMALLFGGEIEDVGLYGGIIVGIQAIILVTTIFFTEAALKRKFEGYKK